MVQKISLSIFSILLFISCSSEDNSLMIDLNANRQLWQSSQIESYKWVESISCEWGGPLLRDIFVVNNKKDRVDFDESLLFEGLTDEDIFNAARTIDEAFDFIESLLSQNVASLNVEYDEIYGFPTIISVDYDIDFVDDEVLYRYTNFEISSSINSQ